MIVLSGLFIAMLVVFERILVINTGFMRVSFVFIPVAIGGAIFGPVWNGLIYAAADILGVMIMPGQGAYFPGFTISAFLSGAVCGFFLKSAAVLPSQPLASARALLLRAACASFCVTVIVNALLNSLWISIIADKAYMFYFVDRLIKNLVMLPVNVVMFSVVWRALGKHIKSEVIPKIHAM